MTQNQIAYLEYLEKHRSNVAQESIARDTLAETIRTHKENESINWFSAKEQGRHNLVSEEIDRVKANAAQVQAHAATMQAEAAQSQATTAARNFLINVTNADTARLNASSNARQASAAESQAKSAETSIWTRMFGDGASSIASSIASYKGRTNAAEIGAAARIATAK